MSDISDELGEAGNKVILIADDDAQIRRIMKMICSGDGYEVHTVEDGQKAFEFYMAKKPDLIFTDQNMRPGMNGFELIEKIKQYGNGVPVVLVSGDTLTRDGVIAHGFADFISKPYHADDIIERINTYIPRLQNSN